MLSTRDSPQTQGHVQTKTEGLEKDISCKWGPKESRRAILISDKIECEIKTMIRYKEGHYIMIKGSIQKEDITIINIQAPNIGAPQYVRQMLTSMKGEITNTIIVGDFNTPPHLWIDQPNRKLAKKHEC